MEYITIDENNKLHFKPELYLFLVLTIICTVISASVWGAMQMVLIKKDDKVKDSKHILNRSTDDEENGLLSRSGVDGLSWLPPSTIITPKAQ